MTPPKKKPISSMPAKPGESNDRPSANGEVFTLAEAAQYLRVAEADVLRLAQQQDFPGRLLGNEWRFLKSAIQDWLRSPSKGRSEGIWAFGGVWKDDPHVDQMLEEIYRRRRRLESEE